MPDPKVKYRFDRKGFLKESLDPPYWQTRPKAQIYVSEETGISQAKLSRLKNDLSEKLTVQEYIKLCNSYGLDPGKFIKEDLFGE